MVNKIKILVDCALRVRENAFAARSEHKVGASVLTTDGEIFGGCNIESNISGLGICAERCAINNAIANGHPKIKSLLFCNDENPTICGACLQYLIEFIPLVGTDIEIFTYEISSNILTKHSLIALLPLAYTSKKKTKIEDYKQKYAK